MEKLKLRMPETTVVVILCHIIMASSYVTSATLNVNTGMDLFFLLLVIYLCTYLDLCPVVCLLLDGLLVVFSKVTLVYEN